jgi:hypothetical protein
VTNEQLDELISCYLDGELSQQETQQLESQLQSDPEAARRVRIMREARKALQDSQTYRLPDHFAARVLAAAKEEAERLGLPANHPIRLAESHRDHTKTVEDVPSIALASSAAAATPASDKKMRWTWAYAAAAAVVLIGGTIWWQAQDSASNNQKSQLAQDNKPTETQLSNETQLPNETQLADVDKSTTKPATESNDVASGSKAVDAISAESKPNVSNVATNDVGPSLVPAKPDSLDGPSATLDNQAMLNDLANMSGEVETLNVLMVIDVTLTKEAWENQSFSRILNEYGIRFEEPIVADESLNKALENSNLVAKSGTDANPADPIVNKNSGDVELVFIQARAARIDNAVKDIFERIDEYPSLYFDLSMDGPCQDVITRLEASAPFEDDGEEVFGIATAVRNGNQNPANANGFAGAKPRGAAVPLANRQNKQKSAIEDPVSMNPISTVLFILRKPEGASGRP